jgi:hypothetical protein
MVQAAVAEPMHKVLTELLLLAQMAEQVKPIRFPVRLLLTRVAELVEHLMAAQREQVESAAAVMLAQAVAQTLDKPEQLIVAVAVAEQVTQAARVLQVETAGLELSLLLMRILFLI